MSDRQPVERIAAFDVDHTITTRDCVVPFLWRVSGPVALANGMLRQARSVVKATAMRDRDLMKQAGVAAAFRGHRLDDVVMLAEQFAAEVHDRHLRHDVVDRLRVHLAEGDTVVLVSASFEVYLRPLAASLGVQHVLATRLAVDDAGLLTGALSGPNCRGPEKVRRLHAWLDARGADRSQVHVTAYGDSTGDRELLLDADEPHWVGNKTAPSWFPSP